MRFGVRFERLTTSLPSDRHSLTDARSFVSHAAPWKRHRFGPRGTVLILTLVAVAASANCAARSPTAVGDAQTAARVKTALVNHHELGTLPIDVRARGGVVTLAGTVRSVEDIDRIVALVRGVTGVARVDSMLEIGEPDLADRRFVPRRPALAPRPTNAPVRMVAVGASTRIASPASDVLGSDFSVGPIVRLRPRDGLGPAIAFNWTDTAVETGPFGQPALATVKLRPVMAGVEYGVVRGRLSAGASIVAGYAFNSLRIDTERAAPGRAIGVRNSFVWRPGVSMWFDVTPRIGINIFGGYLSTRPTVTFASDASVLAERLRVQSAVVSIGAAYWLF